MFFREYLALFTIGRADKIISTVVDVVIGCVVGSWMVCVLYELKDIEERMHWMMNWIQTNEQCTAFDSGMMPCH